MTFHMNQVLHPFYTLCGKREASGSCGGKQMDKMHTENHCTEQVFGLWRVALRPGSGHCPAHSHLGRDQCYASQAESVLRMSDTEQESTTSPEPVTIHCVRGGRLRRGNIWTRHISLRDGGVGIILNGAESDQSLDAMVVAPRAGQSQRGESTFGPIKRTKAPLGQTWTLHFLAQRQYGSEGHTASFSASFSSTLNGTEHRLQSV